jgi:hypothetical protein
LGVAEIDGIEGQCMSTPLTYHEFTDDVLEKGNGGTAEWQNQRMILKKVFGHPAFVSHLFSQLPVG